MFLKGGRKPAVAQIRKEIIFFIVTRTADSQYNATPSLHTKL
jgi:hypothetical protein